MGLCWCLRCCWGWLWEVDLWLVLLPVLVLSFAPVLVLVLVLVLETKRLKREVVHGMYCNAASFPSAREKGLCVCSVAMIHASVLSQKLSKLGLASELALCHSYLKNKVIGLVLQVGFHLYFSPALSLPALVSNSVQAALDRTCFTYNQFLLIQLKPDSTVQEARNQTQTVASPLQCSKMHYSANKCCHLGFRYKESGSVPLSGTEHKAPDLCLVLVLGLAVEQFLSPLVMRLGLISLALPTPLPCSTHVQHR